MRLFAVLGLLALLAGGPAGCGESKKGDNSNIQTPNDQPIGAPSGLKSGGGKPGDLGTVQPGKGGPGKPLPTVEIK